MSVLIHKVRRFLMLRFCKCSVCGEKGKLGIVHNRHGYRAIHFACWLDEQD